MNFSASSFLSQFNFLGISNRLFDPLRFALLVLSSNPEHWINFSPDKTLNPICRLSSKPAISFALGRFLLFLAGFFLLLPLNLNQITTPLLAISLFADTVNQLTVLIIYLIIYHP